MSALTFHVWRGKGLGQGLYSFVITRSTNLAEAQDAFAWFDPEERPVVELLYLGAVQLPPEASSALIQQTEKVIKCSAPRIMNSKCTISETCR